MVIINLLFTQFINVKHYILTNNLNLHIQMNDNKQMLKTKSLFTRKYIMDSRLPMQLNSIVIKIDIALIPVFCDTS